MENKTCLHVGQLRLEHENDANRDYVVECQLLDVGLHVFSGEECELHQGEHQLAHQGCDPSLVQVFIINTSER